MYVAERRTLTNDPATKPLRPLRRPGVFCGFVDPFQCQPPTLEISSCCCLNELTASLLSSGWPFGSLVCKMSGMVQGISVSASVFTLVAIAVDRYGRLQSDVTASQKGSRLFYLLANRG